MSVFVSLASASLAEPSAQSALTPAAQWMESLVLGSIATTLGVLAIAVCGLLMLSGRIDVRRGITVVIGCFIVFGAPVIAAGLRSIGQGDAPPLVARPVPIVPAMPPPTNTPLPAAYDPYAGASIAR